jgi:hypothetical protein
LGAVKQAGMVKSQQQHRMNKRKKIHRRKGQEVTWVELQYEILNILRLVGLPSRTLNRIQADDSELCD